ncbi:helix-turn-helix domain-containing protein [Fructilactobacillus sanfranciscensis]|uniref:helix-turn-helix domain-containing protein n=1 Tax=Fructilactobacillus sanfranciscensis TaxID=1625 RepID=UPI001456E802|nr:helix-turn-helix transcriptional regulator [Fructilactobacillus sanfranciscensis]
MIRNRLSELLAERKIKISKIASDIPDLSRNTITSVAHNNVKMLQLNTINKLCEYLEVTPADFFEYVDYDLKIADTTIENGAIGDISDPFGLAIAGKKSDDFSTGLFIYNLEIFAYLNKSSISESRGETKKTFELTILPKKRFIEIPENDDYISADFEVLTTSKSTMDDILNITKEIGAGFKSDLQTMIEDRCTHAINEWLKEKGISSEISTITSDFTFTYEIKSEFNQQNEIAHTFPF